MPSPRFQKGNKAGLGNHKPRPGSGRTSELHRAECRKLLEEGKFNKWLSDVGKGKNEEVFVTLGGNVRKIPASIVNRIKAIQYLTEQGHGLTPRDPASTISPEKVKEFEQSLLSIFQKHIPKAAYSKELVQAVLSLSEKLFEGVSDEE